MYPTRAALAALALLVPCMLAPRARGADAAPASPAVHVAPTGDDAAPGSADRPVATLHRALMLARAPQGPRRILVRGGDYYDVSVQLGPVDAGLTIEAAPGERPVLYGGVPLAGWARDGETLWAAPLPAGRAWDVRLLRVNGRMCPRARLPETGTFTHETTFDVPWMSTTGGGWKRKPTTREVTTLKYKAADLGDWLDTKSAEITVYHMWDESSVGVIAVDVATRTLTLSPATGHPPGAFGVKKYVVCNVKEGLTRPGQWYHDRARNRIVYRPLDGEDMTRAAVVVPTTPTILRVRGAASRPVRNVTLRGLSLSVTTVPLITGGFGAAHFDGAVSLEQTEDCTLENLTIAQVAGHAINTRSACSRTRVEGCDVSETGAGGIYAGGPGTLIADNHVRGVGRSFPSAIGIFRGGKASTVRNNEVHDCTYSAINYGGEGTVIEANLLYDCMKVLHDGGAIYVFAGKNTVLRRNVARDFTDTGGYGASAYYLDERSEGCVVEENLSVNVGWPSHNHMAKGNTIRNNVFVVAGDAKLTFPRSSDFALEGNVVYATGKITIQNPAAVTSWTNNVLFSKVGKVEGVKLADYAAAGATAGAPGGTTVTADPLFADVGKEIFTYREGSPALKLGLKPLDPRMAGRRTASAAGAPATNPSR